MLLDYHIHALAHGEYEYSDSWLRLYAQNALQKGFREIGFSEHDEYLPQIKPAILENIRGDFPELSIKMGLEVDYLPGRELRIQQMLQNPNYAYDYIIGSVHFINGWAFDHPDYRDRFATQDIDDVYDAYFTLLNQAVNSGLFDIVGHLDLIKIWGHRPAKRTVQEYVEPVLNSVKKTGTVIEINSSGLRKLVQEMYPSRKILEIARAMDIPITLGSDAHHPSQLGEGLPAAARMAKEIGYKQLATFSGRRVQMVDF